MYITYISGQEISVTINVLICEHVHWSKRTTVKKRDLKRINESKHGAIFRGEPESRAHCEKRWDCSLFKRGWQALIARVDMRIGERLPSCIGDFVQRVISQNNQEKKRKLKWEKKVIPHRVSPFPRKRMRKHLHIRYKWSEKIWRKT